MCHLLTPLPARGSSHRDGECQKVWMNGSSGGSKDKRSAPSSSLSPPKPLQTAMPLSDPRHVPSNHISNNGSPVQTCLRPPVTATRLMFPCSQIPSPPLSFLPPWCYFSITWKSLEPLEHHARNVLFETCKRGPAADLAGEIYSKRVRSSMSHFSSNHCTFTTSRNDEHTSVAHSWLSIPTQAW